MDGVVYQGFFLEPQNAWQRRYEAMRAVFVDGQPMPEVARRFGVSHGTVRNWASAFRQQHDADQAPPFSQRRAADVRRARRPKPRRRSPSPTRKPCPWKRDDG